MFEIKFDAGDILFELILCGKINIKDIPFEQRIQVPSVYTAEHRASRHLRNNADRCRYLALMRIMTQDISKIENPIQKKGLVQRYIRYKDTDEEHGLVLEDFP